MTAATTSAAGLLTDLYELTMAAAFVAERRDDAVATFSLFVRDLPPTRGYLVAAGLDAALTHLEALGYGPDELAYLDSLGMFDVEFLDRLARARFTGSVRAVPEGTIVFAGEPLLEVTGPIVEAQLAETFLLNQLTTATTLASKAARYRHAARGRPVVDFSFRRAQGFDAGMAVARAAAVCGLAGTSNVAAAQRYDVAVSGTMAHSFVQAHTDETAAFLSYAEVFGERSVLLVDTYDTHDGVERAIDAARRLRRRGVEVRGIRLDSGDLAALARAARKRLDDEGFPGVQIMASGGLDEHVIERLVDESVPIDAFGVGSDLGVSADAPVLDSVYKLVAFDGRPVRKRSPGKATWPGPKQVWRRPDWSGDVLALADEPCPADGGVPLLVEVMRDGIRTDAGMASLADARACFEAQWAQLPTQHRRLRHHAAWPVTVSSGLAELTESLEVPT